jgi:hypothetical protein
LSLWVPIQDRYEEYGCKNTEIKSFGQNTTGICCEGSESKISRAVVLMKKKRKKEEEEEEEEEEVTEDKNRCF